MSDEGVRVAVVVGGHAEGLSRGNARPRSLSNPILSDVIRMHECLIDPNRGACDPEKSIRIEQLESAGQLYDQLSRTLQRLTGQDQIVFYFSGHGCVRHGAHYALECSGEDDLFYVNGLFTMIDAAGLSRALIILDACYSGQATSDRAKSHDPSTGRTFVAESLPQGIAVLASSRPLQRSFVSKTGTGSAFTDELYYLCEIGIPSAPDKQYIDIADAQSHIRARLADTGLQQTPTLKIIGAVGSVWLTRNAAFSPSSTSYNGRFVSDTIQLSWEDQPSPDAAVIDLDLELVNTVRRAFKQRLIAGVNDTDGLRSARITIGEDRGADTAVCNAAAAVFTHDLPEHVAPCQFTVRSNSGTIERHEVVVGSLRNRFEQLISLVGAHVISPEVISESGVRKRLEEFDHGLARELIANAIAHRDYTSASPVQVAVTETAVVVENAGDFPKGVTWAEICSGTAASMPINPKIASYLAGLGIIERCNGGSVAIRRYMDLFGHRAVSCETEGGRVRITMRRFDCDNSVGIFHEDDGRADLLRLDRASSSLRAIQILVLLFIVMGLVFVVVILVLAAYEALRHLASG